MSEERKRERAPYAAGVDEDTRKRALHTLFEAAIDQMIDENVGQESPNKKIRTTAKQLSSELKSALLDTIRFMTLEQYTDWLSQRRKTWTLFDTTENITEYDIMHGKVTDLQIDAVDDDELDDGVTDRAVAKKLADMVPTLRVLHLHECTKFWSMSSRVWRVLTDPVWSRIEVLEVDGSAVPADALLALCFALQQSLRLVSTTCPTTTWTPAHTQRLRDEGKWVNPVCFYLCHTNGSQTTVRIPESHDCHFKHAASTTYKAYITVWNGLVRSYLYAFGTSRWAKSLVTSDDFRSNQVIDLNLRLPTGGEREPYAVGVAMEDVKDEKKLIAPKDDPNCLYVATIYSLLSWNEDSYKLASLDERDTMTGIASSMLVTTLEALVERKLVAPETRVGLYAGQKLPGFSMEGLVQVYTRMGFRVMNPKTYWHDVQEGHVDMDATVGQVMSASKITTKAMPRDIPIDIRTTKTPSSEPLNTFVDELPDARHATLRQVQEWLSTKHPGAYMVEDPDPFVIDTSGLAVLTSRLDTKTFQRRAVVVYAPPKHVSGVSPLMYALSVTTIRPTDAQRALEKMEAKVKVLTSPCDATLIQQFSFSEQLMFLGLFLHLLLSNDDRDERDILAYLCSGSVQDIRLRLTPTT